MGFGLYINDSFRRESNPTETNRIGRGETVQWGNMFWGGAVFFLFKNVVCAFGVRFRVVCECWCVCFYYTTCCLSVSRRLGLCQYVYIVITLYFRGSTTSCRLVCVSLLCALRSFLLQLATSSSFVTRFTSLHCFFLFCLAAACCSCCRSSCLEIYICTFIHLTCRCMHIYIYIISIYIYIYLYMIILQYLILLLLSLFIWFFSLVFNQRFSFRM